MWDYSVEHIGLKMTLDVLSDMPAPEVPGRYGWRLYQPGDEVHWAKMWVSAGGFKTEEAAIECFHRDFPDVEALQDRMIFLTDGGIPFATATAWFGSCPEEGRIHWVCIDEAHQKQGLSKVLIELVLRRCCELGCSYAYLLTNTPNWVAIRMYHRYGFRAAPRNERDLVGWKIVSEKTGIDFLKEIE